jgi:hypothetical protein
MSKRPAKIANVELAVRTAVCEGRVRFSTHALTRMMERELLRVEVKAILESGFHEAAKDKLDEPYNAWNYAVRGRTLDGRSLRIIVAAEHPDFLVVTTIDLDRESE